jgi:hypothetical protein
MLRLAILLLGVAIVAPPAAHAEGQTVHRCIGEHGEISFSGTPCAGASTPAESAASASASASSSIAIGRASPARTCPASEDALRDLIAEAFTRRDANALAGVMRWDGVGGAAASQRMRELAELTQRPLLGIDIDRGTNEAIPRTPPPDESATLTVHTGGLDGGASEYAFRLMPSGGCYWLDW